MDPMYKIGEALIGDGPELAHVDLLIGDKKGPVGQAFANGLSNLSVGHTPLTSVIRPNLMTKPATLIIPKVTVGDLDDASKIFGPAQTAVARAVADAVEELDEVADFRTKAAGGQGAACEIIRRVLKEKGLLDTIMERYRK